MSKIIDFTNADHGLRDYGGSDAKKPINKKEIVSIKI